MYLRLTITGLLGLYERWSVNPVFDPQGEIENNWNQPLGQQMVDAASAVALPTSLRSLLVGHSSVASFRLEGRHNADDRLLGWAEKTLSSPVYGTGSTNVQTMQTAIALSLRTNTAGARGRGRLYWPAIGATVNDSFRLLAPTPAAVAADAKTYLTALGTAMHGALGGTPPWSSLHLAVRSKANAATPHVTSIQVGNILDTQRRRRDVIPESYTTVAYP